MSPYLAASGAAGIAGLGILLVHLPRRLVRIDLEREYPAEVEIRFALGLFAVGTVTFFLGVALHAASEERLLMLAGVEMTLAAVIFYDARFLVVPDLCNVLLAATAIIGPLALPFREAVFGAALCGGLLGAVAWVWRRSTGEDGLGFGDIKLAAALGALLGLEPGLWMVTGAAAGGVIFGALGRFTDRKGHTIEAETPEPKLIAFGAALALVGGGIVLWIKR